MTAPSTDGAAPAVAVYLGGRHVGALTSPVYRGMPGTFTYDRAVLGDQTAAVSVRLPVRADPYPEHEAFPCFENLLPDGDLRDLLAASGALGPTRAPTPHCSCGGRWPTWRSAIATRTPKTSACFAPPPGDRLRPKRVIALVRNQ